MELHDNNHEFAELALEGLFTAEDNKHPDRGQVYDHFYSLFGFLNRLSENDDPPEGAMQCAEDAIESLIAAARNADAAMRL